MSKLMSKLRRKPVRVCDADGCESPVSSLCDRLTFCSQACAEAYLLA